MANYKSATGQLENSWWLQITPIMVQCWLQQIVSLTSNIFSNKLLHFSFKSLNAPSEKIMFLWKFCHLFPVLFYDWNTSINDNYRFFLAFSRDHFLKGWFTFQMEELFFRWGEGAPRGEHWLWWGEFPTMGNTGNYHLLRRNQGIVHNKEL